MRLFIQAFCYAVGAPMLVAGLVVVAFVSYQLASVVDAPEFRLHRDSTTCSRFPVTKCLHVWRFSDYQTASL